MCFTNEGKSAFVTGYDMGILSSMIICVLETHSQDIEKIVTKQVVTKHSCKVTMIVKSPHSL